MENAEVARVLDRIGDLIELQDGNPFRVRAYHDAARTVRDSPRRLEDMTRQGEPLAELPSIGDKTADKINEILQTGTCQRLEQLRAEVPDGLPELMKVPGLGPRKTMQLHQDLGVASLDELAAAARDGRVRELEGMGEKTEEKILEGIELVARLSGRPSIQEAAGAAEGLARHLDRCPAVARWQLAGSLRRRKETIGDLDVLVEAADREAATAQLLDHDAVDDVLLRGEERVSVRLRSGLQIDYRFFEQGAFGAALLYFTGSKAHTVRLRKIAVERGWKLNEYGLYSEQKRLAGRTERAVYSRIGLPWIPPELREDRGEIEAAEQDRLPRLIEPEEIRGDLQSHTTASDGEATIRQMAEAARRRGHQYLAITDHSKRVTMANGLDDDAALRHAEAIREVDASLDDIWLLAGIEVDILARGDLDLKRETLEQLDWVLGAIHYDLQLDRRSMTDRLLAAIGSGLIDALAHPLGRIIGEREPINCDVDAVIEACVEHGVRLEINASPERLDLPDTYCKRAAEAGVVLTIGSDAHEPSALDHIGYGVDVARRGWLSKQRVLNTRTAKQLARELRRGAR